MYDIYEKLLEAKGVTTADVCKATGISQSTMSNWKKRRNNISADNAKKLADYFGVTVGYLMGVQENAQDKAYYKDAKSAMIAQQMFEDPQLHALHHVKQNIDPKHFQALYDMIVALYKAENPNDNYDFNGDESPE